MSNKEIIHINTGMDIDDYKFKYDLFFDKLKELYDYAQVLKTEGIIEPSTEELFFNNLTAIGNTFQDFVNPPDDLNK